MNTDTQGTGTLPAPRSYMVIGGVLAQVRRGARVGAYTYRWDLGRGLSVTAGERPDYITLTYEQDRELRETYRV